MKNQKKRFVFVLIGMFLFVISGSACFAFEVSGMLFVMGKTLQQIEQTAAGDANKVSGKIESLEPGSNSLTLQMETDEAGNKRNPQFVKIFLDEKTVIQDEKQRLNLDDLNVGEKVKVIFSSTWLGKNTAHMIIIK